MLLLGRGTAPPPIPAKRGPQLRSDLDRFTFLLGGNDGEPLFQPDPLSALHPAIARPASRPRRRLASYRRDRATLAVTIAIIVVA
jgi:hypothetical protein